MKGVCHPVPSPINRKEPLNTVLSGGDVWRRENDLISNGTIAGLYYLRVGRGRRRKGSRRRRRGRRRGRRGGGEEEERRRRGGGEEEERRRRGGGEEEEREE